MLSLFQNTNGENTKSTLMDIKSPVGKISLRNTVAIHSLKEVGKVTLFSYLTEENEMLTDNRPFDLFRLLTEVYPIHVLDHMLLLDIQVPVFFHIPKHSLRFLLKAVPFLLLHHK